MNAPTENPYLAFVRRFRDDRVGFVRTAFGAEPERWQAEVLRELDAGETRLSIRSGHGVGKTTLLAWVAIHFIVTRVPSKTAVTAPSSGQLFDALANEVKVWIGRMEGNVPALKGLLTPTSDRVALTAAPEMGFISYRTARKENPEALQGIHADHVLLIADEASGVYDEVFEAAAGSMSTHGAITILAGNPTRRQGFFFNTHNQLKEFWKWRKVACSDSTRVAESFIASERTFGEGSNRFRVRVLGEFPLADDDTLIPFYMVEEASKRDISVMSSEPIYWGLDVARSLQGDRSALAKRQGNVLKEKVRTWRLNDLMSLVGAVRHEWDSTPLSQRPEEIFVDAIGLGAGAADRLREMGLPAVGINVSESPSVLNTSAARLRDELWINARDWFMSRVVGGPFDQALMDELSTPIVAYLSNGRMQVESKDKMKARGMPSPDMADAFCLTFARTGAAAAGMMAGSSWKKGALHRKGSGRV
jgi:phage terminase large subunit